MKIATGLLRGMKLEAPAGVTTRPTSSKVREALINILMPDLGDAVVIDLFAGSGAIGLELASAGAAAVCFVERDPRALRALRQNVKEAAARLEKQGYEAPQVTVLSKDLSKAWSFFETLPPAHIVWVDPPYAEGVQWAKLVKEKMHPFLAPEGKLVFEFDAGLIKNLGPDFYEDAQWESLKTKTYGHTALVIWRKKG